MDIKTVGRGEKMINKVGQLLVENKQIKIMKIYSGYMTIITKECECDEFFRSLSDYIYLGYVPEHDLYLYI
ncbi:hypothetical protein MX111_04140 [Streptococcus uberis]|uniref:hypothetical protein n=1 Tax=Streptococcus uberis TaxID=1349 RepID=UPI0027DD7328|nr:hypothetical protein [Streptococcus uberis]MCK1238636.1 hypothetical protein [Streptococcus uberis]